MKKKTIALFGNPNSGKTSLFNHLTGLNQRTGNFPGVTVDLKSGTISLDNNEEVNIIDVPGTYSIYPRTEDEKVATNVLLNKKSSQYPDLLVVVLDASNLQRNLLLLSQVNDLNVPYVIALTKLDIIDEQGDFLNIKKLQNWFKTQIIPLNAKTGEGISTLKSELYKSFEKKNTLEKFIQETDYRKEIVAEAKNKLDIENEYEASVYLNNLSSLSFISAKEKQDLNNYLEASNFDSKEFQSKETIDRYQKINTILKSIKSPKPLGSNVAIFTRKLDNIVTHKIWGYLFFFALLFIVFQALYHWASVPMELIDASMGNLVDYLKTILPDNKLSRLFTEGLIAGLGGVIIFIPQIALLFAFIAILEESGYMTRVIFITDRIMRVFGLNGKSIVPLIGGVACAVPAVMAARNIDNLKERLITIFITPLVSCSARLPVYAIIIGLVIPDEVYLGIINLRGLILMALYLSGFLVAFVTAFVMQKLMKIEEKSFLIMEFPEYSLPRFKNIMLTVFEKSKTFVIEAGKIIIAISIILWVLASFSPSVDLDEFEEKQRVKLASQSLTPDEIDNKIAALKLEKSYAGMIGRVIEPAIAPLGYDWKIGIALLTSFAAREVFVGTMATIYSVGNDAEETTLIKRMQSEINPITGKKRYDLATGISLLVFYVFAMQCMSTFAVVQRETKSWRWPIIQLVYMSSIAYLFSFIAYQSLSI